MTSRTENIKKTTSFAYLFGLSSQGIEVFFFFLMFKYFTVEEIGLFSWAMAAAAFFAVFMDLGQNQILVREFSKGNLSVREAFNGTALFRLPLLILGLLIVNFWFIFYSPAMDKYWVILLSCMIQLLMMAEAFFKSWLSGNSRQNIANALDFSISAGRILVILVLIFMLQKVSVFYLFLALLVLHVAIVAVSCLVTFREYKRIGTSGPGEATVNGSAAKMFMLPSLIFGFMAVFTVVQNRLDWLMISHYISETELAHYSLANKFYEVFLAVFGIAVRTAYPWMCRENETAGNDSRLSLYINLIVVTGTLTPLFIALYAPSILHLLWGDKYQSSGSVVELLMVAASIATIAGVGYYLTLSKNGESRIMPVLVFATVAQVTVNFFLIPRYGSMGAAMGMLTMAIVSAAGYLWVLIAGDMKSVKELKMWVVFQGLVLSIYGVLKLSAANILLSSIIILTFGIFASYYLLIPINERSHILTKLGKKL